MVTFLEPEAPRDPTGSDPAVREPALFEPTGPATANAASAATEFTAQHLTQPADGSGVSVHVDWVDTAVVLTVTGEVDILSAPQLQEAAELALGNRPGKLVIDLTGVTFLASAGLAVLAACRQLSGQQTQFRVVAHGPATSRPIELTGLGADLQVFPTLDEALAD